jgi:serine/threonine protein kinase
MSLAGQQLGHYRLTRQIGGGAMGEVYLAEDTRLPRQVAIKVIRAEAPSYPHSEPVKELERLFQREMKAITLLDHPHILPLFDFGEEKLQGMTFTYMVMPYRPEGSLSDWLRQRGGTLLSPEEVARLIEQAADALQHAHDQRIIHQDIKPSNFLLRQRNSTPNRPDLLLADFGIAKLLSGTSTTTQSVRGTPAYMPPEQWEGRPIPASDQYALAIMAYQLLTGQFPFQGGPGQMMHQHFSVQPQPPSRLNGRISPALDAVIMRALAKRPEERFPTILSFAQAFQQALHYNNELRATLVIRQDEAINGTQRQLTLPNKRKVTAFVPAGTQDGQEIRLLGQGEAYYEGGPSGTLVLTISIGSNEEVARQESTNNALTLASAGQSGSQIVLPPPPPPPPQYQPVQGSQFYQSGSFTPPTPFTPMTPSYVEGPPPRKGPSTATVVLLTTLAILILLSAGGWLLFNASARQAEETNTNATATAQAQATLSTQKTATTNTQGNATATAQVQATQTAVIGATATVVAQNPAPYAPEERKLIVLDPLTQKYYWQSYSNTDFGGSCQFKDGSYHVTQIKSVRFYHCSAATEDLANATFEVEMTVISGNCGGITFRSDPTPNKLYFFRVCTSGSYGLYLYVDSEGEHSKTLLSSSSSAVSKGLNQANLLAVVTNGSNFDLYINKQKVSSITDSTHAQGLFGLVANNLSASTEVSYRNARIWA